MREETVKKTTGLRDEILELIERHGPNYGLGFWEMLRADGCDVSTDIYSVLRSMEDDGLLKSIEGDHGLDIRGGRPRRYYEMTNEGRAWLQKRRLA
jgi:DNA-binding PadR family transcriptional regulator